MDVISVNYVVAHLEIDLSQALCHEQSDPVIVPTSSPSLRANTSPLQANRQDFQPLLPGLEFPYQMNVYGSYWDMYGSHSDHGGNLHRDLSRLDACKWAWLINYCAHRHDDWQSMNLSYLTQMTMTAMITAQMAHWQTWEFWIWQGWHSGESGEDGSDSGEFSEDDSDNKTRHKSKYSGAPSSGPDHIHTEAMCFGEIWRYIQTSYLCSLMI